VIWLWRLLGFRRLLALLLLRLAWRMYRKRSLPRPRSRWKTLLSLKPPSNRRLSSATCLPSIRA